MFACGCRDGEVCAGEVCADLPNTRGKKQGQALDSQTSFTLHSEAESATDLLYQLLSYCSQCIFLKVDKKTHKSIAIPASESLQQRNRTCC